MCGIYHTDDEQELNASDQDREAVMMYIEAIDREMRAYNHQIYVNDLMRQNLQEAVDAWNEEYRRLRGPNIWLLRDVEVVENARSPGDEASEYPYETPEDLFRCWSHPWSVGSSFKNAGLDSETQDIVAFDERKHGRESTENTKPDDVQEDSKKEQSALKRKSSRSTCSSIMAERDDNDFDEYVWFVMILVLTIST